MLDRLIHELSDLWFEADLCWPVGDRAGAGGGVAGQARSTEGEG